MRFSIPHRPKRVFSFFDFRFSFSRFFDFIEVSREKIVFEKLEKKRYFVYVYVRLYSRQTRMLDRTEKDQMNSEINGTVTHFSRKKIWKNQS